MTPNRILVVDDDVSLRRIMKMQLEEAGYQVDLASDGQQAYEMLREQKHQLVISDLNMPTSGGIDLLRRISEDDLQTTLIIITAFGTVETAVRAMKMGAYDYVTKPLDFEALTLVVNRAMERQSLLEEVRNLRLALDQKYGFESIVGRSKALLRVLDQAARVAPHDTTVLIQGETGTGKELLARAIHHNSRRKNKPFITINCGAIPRDLVESELFGYTRGAFTGATMDRAGKIELADNGTLFLDEIGELPLEAQVKLLRVLQQGEISKIGSSHPVKVNVRVIAATHRNLSSMIEDENFREDLYYRLAVVPLHLPPLRERKEDIPELVEHMFRKIRERHGLNSVSLGASVMPHLLAYRWPGNLRELENMIERLLVLAPRDEIGVADLPEEVRKSRPSSSALLLDLPDNGISLEGVERELIVRALERSGGNQTQAARYLDISRRTLAYRMEKHGLAPDPQQAERP
ncbi:sigma-54-dependent transcriptional regulator [Acidipila rosea]|uniref:Two-component system NtrC family response regulator n=1 Tax=Acidipila rosea TaxID=768535 RepID=A0A4R1L1W2_9BACT|nr:sigma-54 dependent transcriptional regulator [Acidipila rosea]MBW4027963.1 sigma-54-dependent Fis family transcriptional regulator [Acidobacteriota bacterium]MBW4045808.1 sigma-54-dependent Fis family transcriptional regulator [Acidobacteriota bacterium]TCK71874.1 two-component system NtrC family response regulator [Acidipila rosea]